MLGTCLITNDRQEQETIGIVDQITHALSSDQVLKAIVDGLPLEVLDKIRKSLDAERQELIDTLEAYQNAKNGKSEALRARAGDDVGALLIAARVAKGWRQKELARRLFLPEQQVQRYEAERYRSISLAGLIRVARTLGVRLAVDISNPTQEPWLPSFEMSSTDVQKILKHARIHNWFDKVNQSDESGFSQLRRTVAEHVGEYGTPSLFRSGINTVEDSSQDWLILAWKAQVTRIYLKNLQRGNFKYRPLNLSWLKDLARLSALPDGPVQAKRLLAAHGIALIIEPQIAGMKIDGAAFLVNEMPVIAMTLRLDFLDNFWFTLVHEVAHVILHYRSGLASGFFDDGEIRVDELETEANDFATNLLIPGEVWKRSPARIATTAEPIERFAKQLGIAPAIVFGRLRMERNNYRIFSDKIGRDVVRKQLLPQTLESSHDIFD